MSTLAALRMELDRIADDGRSVGFWWRDDDAVTTSPALERLIDISRETAVPLALAVVPAQAEAALADRLRREQAVTVLMHGWRHANHAPTGERTAEFGPHRAGREMADDAAAALASVSAAFGPRAEPVFVPPWNRIAPDLARRLPALGYRALSGFGGRPDTPGIARIDTHIDPVEWRGSRSLVPPDAIVAMIRQALARGASNLGFLTHHLVFDEPLWRFCEDVAALAREHPALRPCSVVDLMDAVQPRLREEVPA